MGKDKSVIQEEPIMPSILAYHPTVSVQTADGPYLVTMLLSDWISNSELFSKVRSATGCATWGELVRARINKNKLKSQDIEDISIVKSSNRAELMAGADTPI